MLTAKSEELDKIRYFRQRTTRMAFKWEIIDQVTLFAGNPPSCQLRFTALPKAENEPDLLVAQEGYCKTLQGKSHFREDACRLARYPAL